MKVTRAWLQNYFDTPLPPVAELADAFTFHAFEIDSFEGDLMDVKVLPNRAADCLSVRGLALELSAILDIPLNHDPLRDLAPTFDATDAVGVVIEDAAKCSRYMAAVVKGVKVGPSPAWLKEAVESIGQRSINNVVDAMNYVMFDMGQPLHAFDANKLAQTGGKWKIGVRAAKAGEKLTLLTGEEVTTPADALLIVDGVDGELLGLAGLKGGAHAAITENTTDLIIEAANFDGTAVRRLSQALKLFTDAGTRFQNRPSPELAGYGLKAAIEEVLKVAGGEAAGVVDVYPVKPEIKTVSASLAQINSYLGSSFSKDEVEGVFKRLTLDTRVEGDTFIITPPFERTDLVIMQDLVEEVGRIIGYDRVPATQLPPIGSAPDQSRFRGIEKMKDQLVAEGFTEVSTQSFAKKGDIQLANPLDVAKPYLRTSLEENLKEALTQAKHHAPLVLAPGAKPKLFEVGSVFPKSGEFMELRMTEQAWEGVPTFDNLTIAKLEDYGKDYTPKKYELGSYTPFSQYPFVARDVAMWVPAGTDVEQIKKGIQDAAGDLMVRLDQFDTFEKEGRVSYAFRLIFQSVDRTLTDEEVNKVMEKVYEALKAKGYEIR